MPAPGPLQGSCACPRTRELGRTCPRDDCCGPQPPGADCGEDEDSTRRQPLIRSLIWECSSGPMAHWRHTAWPVDSSHACGAPPGRPCAVACQPESRIHNAAVRARSARSSATANGSPNECAAHTLIGVRPNQTPAHIAAWMNVPPRSGIRRCMDSCCRPRQGLADRRLGEPRRVRLGE